MSQPDASRTAFSTPMARSSLAWSMRNWMRVRAGERRRLAHRQLARIVLLELSRRAHAVVAQTDRKRRRFLPHLECAVAALHDVRNRRVNPRIAECH